MKKESRSTFFQWLFLQLVIAIFITGTMLLVVSSLTTDALANGESGETIVRGTVTNIIIILTPDGVIVKILELSDGKKYRLRQERVPSISKGSDVELVVPVDFEPFKDEVSAVHPNVIPVISVKVTAIPIPGTKDKLVYPPSKPPEVIKGK